MRVPANPAAEVAGKPRRRAARGHSAASEATRAAVLAAAKTVMIREGHAKFTVRRVAQVAGISSGNMMYHFPTKQHLLRALVRDLLEKDEAEFTRVMQDLTGPSARVEALVRKLIKMGLDGRTNRYYSELHAMAIRDAFAAKLLAKYYEHGMEVAAQLIAESVPAVDKKRVAAVVQLIAAISEGTGLLSGLPFEGTFDPNTIASLAVKLLEPALRERANEA